jgi:hypothetical protein
MSNRPVITTLPAGGRYDTSTLNANFQVLRDAADDVVGNAGVGGSNNSMSGNLDMDDNNIINAGIIYNSAGLDITSNEASAASAASALLAEGYAVKVNGAVVDTDYSAKAHAIGGTGVTDATGSAKEWATEAEDNTVAGSGTFSALHYSAKASAQATAAASSAATATNQATIATAAAQGWSAVTTITGATTNLEIADARDYYILDATSNTITINLPAIGSSDGLLFGFQVSNVDNAISIVRDGSDKINGSAANYSGLTAVGQVIHFIADDATADNWLATIVSQSPDATTSVKGIASFSSDNFAVSSGAVTIKDGGVVTDEIADNAVTLAKMASGTDGNIISFDASGNPVAIATGSNGQVLTSAGAGAQPAFEALPASSQDMVLLSTTNASTASTVDLTGNFTTTYSNYMVRGVDIFGSNSTETLMMQVIFDSTAITGSVYYGHLVRSNNSSNNYSGQAMNGTTAFNIINQLSSGSNQGTGFVLNVLNAPATSNSYKFFTWNGASAEGWSINYGAGGVNDASSSNMTGMRFLMSAGTVSGKFLLYGIK